MSIFDKRVHYKPFEYPEILQFTNAINKSYWVHSEIDFTADVQDFHTQLSDADREIVKRSLLAIAQIEVNVKTFWGDLYLHLPKPEFNGLGSTFAECEFRHSEAYSRLLDVLGYQNQFEQLVHIPIIQERIDYLSNALKNSKNTDQKSYVKSLILFTILIENVSLFSQFAIIISYTRFQGVMKNISNIIAWTSVDEQLHASGGIYIINQIKKEFPQYFDKEFEGELLETVKNSMVIEGKLLDWIFETGGFEFFTKEDLMHFMHFRIDQSLTQIGMPKIYHTSTVQYQAMAWFEEEIFANSMDDFFAKRPVEYTKHDKSITASDLF